MRVISLADGFTSALAPSGGFADGTVSAPGIAFSSEATGLYLAGAADLRLAIAGVFKMAYQTAGTRVNTTAVANSDAASERFSVYESATLGASARLAQSTWLELSGNTAHTGTTNVTSSGSFITRRTITLDTTDTQLISAAYLRNRFSVTAAKTLTNSTAFGYGAIYIDAPEAPSGSLALTDYFYLYGKTSSLNTGTNKYGLYLGDLSGATNNYSLYIGTAKNYIGGDVHVVSSHVTIGNNAATNNTAAMLRVGAALSAKLAGTSQQGILVDPKWTTAATADVEGVQVELTGPSSGMTAALVAFFRAKTLTVGSATITRAVSFYGDAITGATNNAFGADNVTYTGNWNLNLATARPSLLHGGVVPSSAALATNATTGHNYTATSAGTPTGVPTTMTGCVAFQYDTTNNKLYAYNAAWLAFSPDFAESTVVVTTPGAGAAGHGSTNTKFRRYTATEVNTGSDITYADSSTLGASFTINTTGWYYGQVQDLASGGAASFGVSFNSASGTTNIDGIAAADRVAYVSQSIGITGTVSFLRKFTAGAVIRVHDQGSADAATALSRFFITRVR